jgi:hypothetical protein
MGDMFCGAIHPEHPSTHCRRLDGHNGPHMTARHDVAWDNAYLSAPGRDVLDLPPTIAEAYEQGMLAERARHETELRAAFLRGEEFANARHAALVAAARMALDLLPDLSVAYHQTGSIRDHADPKDRTGWNVHGIETCDDSYCTEGLAAVDALRAALIEEARK